MNNFWVILGHTYFSKVKTKSFLITTLITLVLIIALTNMSQIIDMFTSDSKEERIAVMDQSGELFEPLQEQFKLLNEEVQLELFEGSETDGETAVKNEEFEGLLILSLNNEGLPDAAYKARSVANSTLPGQLQQSLQQIKIQVSASQIHLTQEQLGKLYEPVSFSKVALEENAKTAEELNQARGLVYVLLFVIYFAVIMYANMIAMEVATEKSSRVMEILISSVSPIQQMFAKIIGIALLSLTQMGFFLIVGYYFVKRNLESMEGGFFEFFGFGDVPVQTIVYAVVFFILGYFLYATLAAFLGSLVSRIEDVQQMITPMTMMVVAGFLIAMFGLNQPETTFITITSYIPFFTPMLMFMRVGMLTLPTWEPLLGIAILILSIVVLAIFGARVYKGGVLMYGKSSSFKDVKKALQLTKKD
ncbi:ABC-2 type transport system permease protein [Cytobacillus eiseniae]|uniref:ABC-2 type transport system permease protein n=1 Tax=Cytobacillus eiseniae TaxID=762947 RepID=A0ABS4RGV0_9BACI|nr:ABC transporter permease [Cytobacillus eiseniae]MBP2241067.1 ABC-2 type transport system permease protein [Cytobacillus eiseniae]